ncbi:hypothetical protein LIER_26420 [Lithospermum erythrorhizon]|uniref:Uncharacterized protein n=1 Tax=Lithospermum erythrorhizon TaxID=34254 RepID=A0AAV3R8J0_LITER
MPIVKSLWTSMDPVKGRMEKGRVFGVGTSSVAVALLVDDLDEVPQPPPTANVMEELRRKCEEEEARNRALQQETVGLKQKVSTVESELATLKAIVMKLAGTILMEGILPLAASHASAGSSTVTGLLAQMERIYTPVQFMPPQPTPRPQETPSQT